ncbi:MAG TPA: hypothetical protein PLB32_04765 [Acidobacteriota bacterium]|nr:hypothetical protein [Acidobacteriota bacterium]HNB71723.1 hypothetical protein [Acidobacteriota bacterium]HNG92086.1 hypothetical protein [Acidobacteriota bacterium]HNH84675.1 hypothetical protein [Acidobacteriota bacterium]
MLFKSKKSNKTTMLQYATLTGTVTGPSELTVDGKTYTLYTTPLHLAHESKPLDVSAHLGQTIKVSGGTGATAIYEAKIVE